MWSLATVLDNTELPRKSQTQCNYRRGFMHCLQMCREGMATTWTHCCDFTAWNLLLHQVETWLGKSLTSWDRGLKRIDGEVLLQTILVKCHVEGEHICIVVVRDWWPWGCFIDLRLEICVQLMPSLSIIHHLALVPLSHKTSLTTDNKFSRAELCKDLVHFVAIRLLNTKCRQWRIIPKIFSG